MLSTAGSNHTTRSTLDVQESKQRVTKVDALGKMAETTKCIDHKSIQLPATYHRNIQLRVSKAD